MFLTLLYIAHALGVVPLLLLLRIGKAGRWQQPAVPFIWLTAVATLYELIGTLIMRWDTASWFLVYSLLEFACIWYFFQKLSRERYKWVLMPVLLLFIIVYFFTATQLPAEKKMIATVLNQIPVLLLICGCSILWFRDLFNKFNIPNLWQHPPFYFIAAFIIYHFSTFLLFLLSDYLHKSSLDYLNYWIVNILATLLLRLLMIIGTWKMKQD